MAASAINAIFGRWRIRAGDGWNVSGELCSGIASDDVTDLDFSPGIKCDCSYNNRTTCHIYSLYDEQTLILKGRLSLFIILNLIITFSFPFPFPFPCQEGIFNVRLGFIVQCRGSAPR